MVAFLGIGGIAPTELMIIAGLAVILFGSKLPEVARNVGSSYAQFRRGLSDIQSSIKNEIDRELDDVKKIPAQIESAYDSDLPSQTAHEDVFDPPEE